jgi:DNA-binding transcriptional LysR family regulator
MQSMSWDDLRFVLAVARFETVAEAGRRLSVDEATVTRRITRLERHLRTHLFERAQGRLVPTEVGRSVAERAERIESEVAAVVEEASGMDQVAVAGCALPPSRSSSTAFLFQGCSLS